MFEPPIHFFHLADTAVRTVVVDSLATWNNSTEKYSSPFFFPYCRSFLCAGIQKLVSATVYSHLYWSLKSWRTEDIAGSWIKLVIVVLVRNCVFSVLEFSKNTSWFSMWNPLALFNAVLPAVLFPALVILTVIFESTLLNIIIYIVTLHQPWDSRFVAQSSG